jgi:hypothetical protein
VENGDSNAIRDVEIFLAVDTSSSHVGAVLQQREAGQSPWPLAFFSAKLDAAQVKYSTFDRELLACYLAIRHFRWLLEGRQFYILSDHKPLCFALHRLSDAWSARQQRQLSYIAEFTSDIRHVAGVDNVVADALSSGSGAAGMCPSHVRQHAAAGGQLLPAGTGAAGGMGADSWPSAESHLSNLRSRRGGLLESEDQKTGEK